MSYIFAVNNTLRVTAVRTDAASDTEVIPMDTYAAFAFTGDTFATAGQPVPADAVCTADHREDRFNDFAAVGNTANAVAAGLGLPDQRPWGGEWTR
ncbi:hypothetical protein [Paraburkholderia tropica]|uniref:hypothetical protein n=1 Tax=Paraburkholderia tropica TaxID=92647 RepID=UPI002AB18B99|nr:hypothetical protein [Paraburkholderia tropica]